MAVGELILQRVAGNKKGRDLVVGDLHGCRADLDQLLASVGFDYGRDRLFLVGDLIDRGPDSLGCLALLAEPWCLAVRGNHEQLLLDRHAPGGLQDWLYNGGNWAVAAGLLDRAGQDTPAMAAVHERLESLPHVLVVGEGMERFHVVHAELPKGWTDAELDTLPTPGDHRRWCEEATWARRLFGQSQLRDPATQPGLSPTYCGHTIGLEVRTARSHHCLDTGAFLQYDKSGLPEGAQYGMTILEPRTGKQWFLSRLH